MSKQHFNWWKVGWLFEVTFKLPLEVPTILKYGQIYKIICGETSNFKQYEVTIGNFFVCTYMDFVTMIASLKILLVTLNYSSIGYCWLF
jgi:hypothetical protein